MPLTDNPGGPITTVVRVPDDSYVGTARRAAVSMAVGFDENAIGRLSLVVTELATNLARHAVEGEILFTPIARGIEVITLDRGPGIGNLTHALQDGFSTRSTSGTGLGAIRRQADTFDVYSKPGTGTFVACQIYSGDIPFANRALQYGVVCVPYPGEQTCGDGWSLYHRTDGTSVVMVVDGLGHGPSAAIGATTATNVFTRYAESATPVQILDALHLALRPTRGAAVAVAHLDSARRSIHFAGVGNISASAVSASASQSMVSSNGIVGHQMARPREFVYPWHDDAVFIMHSDGLTSRWRLDTMPGILSHDIGIIPAMLYRDATRGRDDLTVLAVRRSRQLSDTPQ